MKYLILSLALIFSSVASADAFENFCRDITSEFFSIHIALKANIITENEAREKTADLSYDYLKNIKDITLLKHKFAYYSLIARDKNLPAITVTDVIYNECIGEKNYHYNK